MEWEFSVRGRKLMTFCWMSRVGERRLIVMTSIYLLLTNAEISEILDFILKKSVSIYQQ